MRRTTHRCLGCCFAFTKATDIYKRLLLESRDDLALNVYVAMCYYKLDYYDVSLEILAVYLQVNSAFGMTRVCDSTNLTHNPQTFTSCLSFLRGRRRTRTVPLPST